MDYAHKKTEKLLKNTEKEIENLYKAAIKDIKNKLDKTIVNLKISKDPKKIYSDLQNKKKLEELIKYMTLELSNADKLAVKIMNNELLNVYSINHNWSAYDIEKKLGVDLNFNIYNKQILKNILESEVNPFTQLAIDELEDKANILRIFKREMFSALTQGESINKIAERIREISDSNYSRAIRIARTETTRIQNLARYDNMKHCEEAGLKVMKKWVSTADSKTRSTHSALQGEEVGIDETFSNGLMYPGDYNGPISETANCRCTVVTEFKDIEKTKSELKLDEEIKNMTFERWMDERS